MILTDRKRIETYRNAGIWADRSLDQWVQQHADQFPDKLALIDPPNRAQIDGVSPRRLTWAELDHEVSHISEALKQSGLNVDDVVAFQLPNTVESPIMLLAIMRANMIASPMPVLWRRRELAQACAEIAPRALVSRDYIDGYGHGDMMRYVAMDVFSVRYIFSCGSTEIDGIIPLSADIISDPFAAPDAAISAQETDARPAMGAAQALNGGAGTAEPHPLAAEPNRLTDKPRALADGSSSVAAHDETQSRSDPANHIATICLDTSHGGRIRPFARSHNQWLCAAAMHGKTAQITPDDIILASYPATTLTSLASGWGPWLTAGACLILHHPYDMALLRQQIEHERVSYAAVPAVVGLALLKDYDMGHTQLTRLGMVWPFTERRITPPSTPQDNGPTIIDIHSFGELATYACRRSKRLRPGIFPVGRILRPEGANGVPLLETRIKGRIQANSEMNTALSGELYLRGPMLPDEQLKPAIDRAKRRATENSTRLSDNGYFATGLNCTLAGPNTPYAWVNGLNGQAEEVIFHGGLRLSAKELDELYSTYDDFLEAAAFGLEDPILGQQLWAAVIPRPGAPLSLEQLAQYIESQGVAPFKVPERLIAVSTIPRGADGKIAREKILDEV